MFEILVVNNDPNDIPPYLVPTDNIKLLVEEKVGSYAARNTAIKAARGTILAFTDSDCIPEKNWLKSGLSNIENGAHRVAGLVEFIPLQSEYLNFPSCFELCAAFRQKRNANKGWSITANLFSLKICFDQVGFFNDKMLSGGDQEWGLRAQAASHNIYYSSETIVFHPIRNTWKSLFIKQKRIVGGLMQLNVSKGKEKRFFFYLKLFLPPIPAWILILKSSNKINIVCKIKACIVALILKYYGLIFIIFYSLNIVKLSRK